MVSTDFDEIDGWECGKRWMPSGFHGLVEYRVLLKFDDGVWVRVRCQREVIVF